MTKSRERLSQILHSIDWVAGVYFQPPPSVRMKYPAIVYHLDGEWVRHADDIRYAGKDRYLVTVIDPNPDSEIPQTLVNLLPYGSFDRFFTSDNLNHTSYNTYL